MNRPAIFKILRCCSLALLSLIALVVLVVLEENQRGKWAWETYKREAEVRGMQFDFRAFIPPPVPDEQNFAMTPLLKPLFGLDADYKTTLSTRLKLTSPKADAKNPGLGGMKDGKRVDLTQWKEYLGQPDLLEALKKFDPELDEISAAIQRPFARFPLRYEDGVSTSLPHMVPLMNLSKLYELRALADLEAGQPERANADAETIFRLAGCFDDEPLLISQLVRVAIMSTGLQVVWEGLETRRWSESQLASMQGRLERIDTLTGVLRAVQFERAVFPEAARGLLNDPKWFGTTMSVIDLSPAREEQVCLRLFLRNTLHQNMLATCQFEEEYLAPAIEPTARRVNVGKIKAGKKKIQAMAGMINPYTFLMQIASSARISTLPKVACAQSTVDEAVIACALERYRLAHGKLPEQLDTLVPQYLAKLPHDIIDGQPLRYRRTADGLFLLYSIGWNETDDNGAIATKDSRPDIEQGDWVWRHTTP